MVVLSKEKAAQKHGRLVPDEELLDTAANLLEKPFAFAGEFDPSYLVLPKAVIIKVLREHQFAFAVERPDGSLAPVFLASTNGITRNLAAIREGNARVVRARLEDARFFFAEDRKVPALDGGADDYMTKPFSPRELAVRVKTVLRRSGAPVAAVERVVVGELEIDAATREVTRAGTALRLTAREFDLLWFLATNPNRVFSRAHLLDRVWGDEGALDSTVTVHMRRLREKVERDPSEPRHLQTVWGVGYRVAP